MSEEKEPEWRDLALCKDATSLFYRDDAVGIVIAKTYCKRCPVENECLISALINREQWGIWGGKTPTERRRLQPYFRLAVSSGIGPLHSVPAVASH